MPFHRQQPASTLKLGTVFEHEGMSLCICAELQSDNSTVTRHFNACLSPYHISSLPHHPSMWSWLDLELAVRFFSGLTLISVSYCFPAKKIFAVSHLFFFFFWFIHLAVALFVCCVRPSRIQPKAANSGPGGGGWHGDHPAAGLSEPRGGLLHLAASQG